MTAARGLGWRPDRGPRDRDLPASAKFGAAPVPAASSNIDLVPDILDQGSLSSCVANAAALALRAALVAGGVWAVMPPVPSRLWLYLWSRQMHHETALDAGTFPRTMFAAAAKMGYPPEVAWPYEDDGETYRKIPPLAVFNRALSQRLSTTYRRIFESGSARVDMVKRALAGRHLVVFGTEVGSDFVAGRLPPGPVGPGDMVVGGVAGKHAMAVVQHDGDAFLVANSWGRGFGDKGFFTAASDLLSWDRTDDLWVVEQAQMPEGA